MSLGNKAASTTALRKLQAAMREGVASSFGKRGDYVRELEGAGGAGIQEALAGQSLNVWAPRGLSRAVAAGGAGYGAASLSPGLIAAAPAFSPRLIGEAAHAAGRMTRPTTRLSQILAQLPQGATPQAMFQTGRAQRETR